MDFFRRHLQLDLLRTAFSVSCYLLNLPYTEIKLRFVHLHYTTNRIGENCSPKISGVIMLETISKVSFLSAENTCPASI